jgi:hypothetical protein
MMNIQDTMKIQDVINEMRDYAEIRYAPPQSATLFRWADALEAAMREPVAQIMERRMGPQYCEWDSSLDAGTKLYALPPDAAGEIERLRNLVDQAWDEGWESGQSSWPKHRVFQRKKSTALAQKENKS